MTKARTLANFDATFDTTFDSTGVLTSTSTLNPALLDDTGTIPSALLAGVGGNNLPAFQAFRTNNQSIPQSTYTKIEFDAEGYDLGGCYNNTGSTATLNGISVPAYSFAPNVAGKYEISACVNSQNPTDYDTLLVSIFKNGTQINRVINSNRHFDSAMTSFIVEANGTSDYFDIQCFSELAGGTNLQGTDTNSRLMWFAATKLIT
jgi:hypothetical protein